MARALTSEQLLAWKKQIERQPSSGLTISEFCRRERISEANFYHWKRKLKGKASRQAPPSRSKRRTVRSQELSLPSSARLQTPDRASGQTDTTHSTTFFQIPMPQPRGAAWIEIVAADGTQIRLPHQNLEAFELALTTLSGQRSRLQ